MDGANGGLVGVRWEGVIGEAWSDSGKEHGLEGVFHWAGTRRGCDNLVAGMGGYEAVGKELG